MSRTGLYLVEYEDGGYSLIDTASAGGVWIKRGGEFARVTERTDVRADDRIRLGAFETSVRDLLNAGKDNVDVFVSYAREDADQALELEAAIARQGWKPWRDTRLGVARSFDQQIEKKLTDARCIIVLWSRHSVTSQWVRAEASVALDRGVLVPVFIERIDVPILFKQIQGVVVDQDAGEARWAVLFSKLEELIGAPSGAGV